MVKKSWRIILGILLLVLYVVGVFIAYSRGILDNATIVDNVFTVAGWVVVLWIGFAHLRKSREDAVESQRDETRKIFQISAFREINESVNKFSKVLSRAVASYTWIPSQLELHIIHPYVTFNVVEIQQKLGAELIELHEAHSEFIGSIEANEMAVLE